jgi:hypothetical protein
MPSGHGMADAICAKVGEAAYRGGPWVRAWLLNDNDRKKVTNFEVRSQNLPCVIFVLV